MNILIEKLKNLIFSIEQLKIMHQLNEFKEKDNNLQKRLFIIFLGDKNASNDLYQSLLTNINKFNEIYEHIKEIKNIFSVYYPHEKNNIIINTRKLLISSTKIQLINFLIILQI